MIDIFISFLTLLYSSISFTLQIYNNRTFHYKVFFFNYNEPLYFNKYSVRIVNNFYYRKKKDKNIISGKSLGPQDRSSRECHLKDRRESLARRRKNRIESALIECCKPQKAAG